VAPNGGLTLLELLLALGLGLVVAMLLIQVLVLQGQHGALLTRLLREKALQRRTIELIRADLLRADAVVLGSAPAAACSLSGRLPLLQLQASSGSVVYSLGAPPSAIWRGKVLMRCGPAFGLDGEPSRGESLNRVVLDGLTSSGLRLEHLGGGRLQLRLDQEFPLLQGGVQRISSSVVLAGLALAP
jgi:hypothetical protein